MFLDRFLESVNNTPHKPACIFLKGVRSVATTYTYRELHQLASNLVRQLQPLELTQRQVGLLCCANDIHFVVSLLACFYLNAIAIPIPHSIFGYAKQRAKSIVTNLELDTLLAPAGISSSIPCAAPIKHRIEINLSSLNQDFDFIPIDRSPTDIALIQYTSGSVTSPKGVLISHQNLLSNQQMIQNAFHHEDGACVNVNWLPFYHDMGLIGGLLQALFAGGYCIQIVPSDFLKNPLLWLRAISDYHAHSSGAPCFGYNLCVDTLDRRRSCPEFDLSTWKVAYCGAEPISEQVFNRFTEAFAKFGFQKSALFPCYGMAEATLIITGAEYQNGYRVYRHKPSSACRSESLISCGKALGDQHIKILSDSGIELQDGEIGEIYLSGSNLFFGYLAAGKIMKPFHLIDGRSYFATGDLGFLHDDELYLTGRKKDLVIVNGVNFYPHDIAWFVGTLDSVLDQLSGTALELVDPQHPETNPVVHLHEFKRGIFPTERYTAELRKRIGIQLTQEYGFPVGQVILLKSGSLPRTASGKIQHRKCRELYTADPAQYRAILQKT